MPARSIISHLSFQNQNIENNISDHLKGDPILKTWQNEAPLPEHHTLIDRIFTESTLFIDIETTGFSPAHAQVCLIGCAARREDKLWITQFFCEKPQEEGDILSAFLTYSSNYDQIVTYNGVRFDLPFLEERCRTYHLDGKLSELQQIDLFQMLSKYKDILKLSDMKLKTVEAFLGIHRKDACTGKDFVRLYQEYSAACNHSPRSEEIAALLKLHNYEDLLGMADLLPALAYCRLYEGDFRAAAPMQNTYTDYHGAQCLECILPLQLDYPLPVRLSFGKDAVYLTGQGDTAKISVKARQGELKYYYPNYRDYYYLPAEDMAMHKSVASYVGKKYRRQATAATCYTRKTGCFLPQYQELFQPCFRAGRHARPAYFELDSPFTETPKAWDSYARHLLQWLLK